MSNEKAPKKANYYLRRNCKRKLTVGNEKFRELNHNRPVLLTEKEAKEVGPDCVSESVWKKENKAIKGKDAKLMTSDGNEEVNEETGEVTIKPEK